MRVDLAASRRYTRRLARAERRGRDRRAAALRRARAQVDERFDPERALAGTARYLTIARKRFGREDMAFVSYHMGIGNLESVLRDFGGRRLSYARVYFDSTPTRHVRAYRRLASLGDDSSNYWWKLAAAREIMRLWREDRPELDRLIALHAAKGSAEEVLHPEADTPRFDTAAELQARVGRRRHRAVPDGGGRVTGLRRDRRMGELAGRVHQPAEPLPRPAAGGARARAVHRRPGARDQRPGAADRHLDRARRPLPGRAGDAQPRGDAPLLAAHDRLGVRRRCAPTARGGRRSRSSSCSTGCGR